jgi:hypothetical protein
MQDIIRQEQEQSRDKYKGHSTFTKEERSDYEETTSRNICYIFHSRAVRNMDNN